MDKAMKRFQPCLKLTLKLHKSGKMKDRIDLCNLLCFLIVILLCLLNITIKSVIS